MVLNPVPRRLARAVNAALFAAAWPGNDRHSIVALIPGLQHAVPAGPAAALVLAGGRDAGPVPWWVLSTPACQAPHAQRGRGMSAVPAATTGATLHVRAALDAGPRQAGQQTGAAGWVGACNNG